MARRLISFVSAPPLRAPGSYAEFMNVEWEAGNVSVVARAGKGMAAGFESVISVSGGGVARMTPGMGGRKEVWSR